MAFCRGHHPRLLRAAPPLHDGGRGAFSLRGKLVRACGLRADGRPTRRLPSALHRDGRVTVRIATGASCQGASARSLQQKLSCPILESAQLGSLFQSPSRATDMLCAAGGSDHLKATTPASDNAHSSTCESPSPCRLSWPSAEATTLDFCELHRRSMTGGAVLFP